MSHKRTCWVSLALVLLVSAALLAGRWWFITKPALVEAMIEIRDDEPILLLEASPKTKADANASIAFQKKQAAVVTNREVLNSALNSLRNDELSSLRNRTDPLAWLEENVEADYVAPDLIRVRLRSDPADEAVKLVNAITNAYVNESVNRTVREKASKRETLERLLQSYESTLADRRRALRALQMAAGSHTSQEPEHIRMQELAACKSEFRRLRLNRTAIEVKLSRQKERGKGDAEAERLVSQFEEELAVLNGQEKMLNDEISRFSTVNASTLDVDDLQTGMASLEAVVTQLRNQVEQLKIEMNAPSRVRLFSAAHVVASR